MTNRYHNTVNVTGFELKERKEQVSKQEDDILAFFKLHKGELFTPFDLMLAVSVGTPITSVRRAITNLTKAGCLIKTETRQRGPYGHLNYCWRLAE